MKIAILFSGQPRTVKLSYENLKDSIFYSEHDIKYFAHIWSESDEGATHKGLKLPVFYEELRDCLEIYKFERVQIDKQKMFKNLWYGKSGEFGNLYPMNYSLQKVTQLFKNYVEEFSENFDFVVRMRFDHYLKQRVDFDKIDINKIHVSGESWGTSPIVDDTICCASQENIIKIYNSIFDSQVEKYKNEQIIPNPEVCFTQHLIDNELYYLVSKNHMFNFGLNRKPI